MLPERAAKPAKPLVVASIVIMVGTVTSGLAIYALSGAAERKVFIAANVQKLTMPAPYVVAFPSVTGIEIRGGNLKISRLRTLSVGTRPVRLNGLGTLSLRSDLKQQMSYVHLVPAGYQGRTTVGIPSGASISSNDDGKTLTVNVDVDKPRITVDSEASIVDLPELDRVTLSLEQQGTGVETAPTLRAANPEVMVALQTQLARSVSISVPCSSIRLDDPNIPLAIPDKSAFSVTAAILDQASFNGAKEADIIVHAPTDLLVLTSHDFGWSSIVAHCTGPARKQSISFVADGYAASLKQNGDELLPSRLADFLSADPGTRGIYGGIAVFVLLLLGTAFKRAVDVFVESLIPESK